MEQTISAGCRIHKHKASWSDTVTILHCLYLPDQQQNTGSVRRLGAATTVMDVKAFISLVHHNNEHSTLCTELSNWPPISQGEEVNKHMMTSNPFLKWIWKWTTAGPDHDLMEFVVKKAAKQSNQTTTKLIALMLMLLVDINMYGTYISHNWFSYWIIIQGNIIWGVENPIIILTVTFLHNISAEKIYFRKHLSWRQTLNRETSHIIESKKTFIKSWGYVLLLKWDFTVIMNTLAFLCSTLLQVHIASFWLTNRQNYNERISINK